MFHLEKVPAEDGAQTKLQLTGKESDMGKSPFNLSKYAKDLETTEKLYIDGSEDKYIEIFVTSKPLDAAVSDKNQNGLVANGRLGTDAAAPPRRRGTKTAPTSAEDLTYVEECKAREAEYMDRI